MRFEHHLRATVQTQIAQMAQKMKEWEAQPQLGKEQKDTIRSNIRSFDHSKTYKNICIAGIDGSGDYPAVSYADSFVYVVIAQGTKYIADATTGLREVGPLREAVTHFAWIPQEDAQRHAAFDNAFSSLAGIPLMEVIQRSDYRKLKSGKTETVDKLIEGLLRPPASDSANIQIQLRSAGELGAALRLIMDGDGLDYVLYDSTMVLPMVSQKYYSIFFEHLKRLCCVEARSRGIGFFALSKSHGLPSIETIEDLAREQLGLDEGKVAEHWYLRLPSSKTYKDDNWELPHSEGRRLPPIGAVTYLVRFHKTTPVMRLDMDLEYWRQHVKGKSKQKTEQAEIKIFEDLDYASHDQRCYGYPYPIKAGHDRASLTMPERIALRKQIIDAAVKAGLKRSLFRDVSMQTGHR